MFIVHLFVSYTHINLCHFFSSSWCQGLAATSACGSSWTFLFTFLHYTIIVGIAPTYTPSIGLVSYGIQKLVNETAKRPYTYTEVYFTCHFVASKTEELWYRVYWYLNAAVLYTSRFGKTPDDIVLRLTEPLFVANGFKLGNEVTCVKSKFYLFNQVQEVYQTAD